MCESAICRLAHKKFLCASLQIADSHNKFCASLQIADSHTKIFCVRVCKLQTRTCLCFIAPITPLPHPSTSQQPHPQPSHSRGTTAGALHCARTSPRHLPSTISRQGRCHQPEHFLAQDFLTFAATRGVLCTYVRIYVNHAVGAHLNRL